MAQPQREYRVRPRQDGHVHARRIVEASVEAAAVAFVEVHAAAAPQDDAGFAVMVLDLETGVEHCFRIDLETGAAAPCG